MASHRRSGQGRAPREARHDGRRIAQLFRQHRGLIDVRCCSLEQILADDEIELTSSDFGHPGYAACLVRTEGGCGIVLPNGQTGGRRRFSIGHELGHYHIPTHSTVSGFCTEADLRAAEGDSRLREWEANDFAAELLMPRRLFAADADAREVSVASAIELASTSYYNVSVMAAARRIVDTTRHAAAIVVSAYGRVEWSRRSEAFRFWLPGPHDRVHNDTMAAASFRQVEVSELPKPVPVAAWVERSPATGGELLESTYRIDSLEKVVSLLWYVDQGDDSEDT